MNIEYKICPPMEGNRNEFISFIINSDKWFYPPLCAITNLCEYAEKLYTNGMKFLCLDGEQIVGAVIAYVNKTPDYSFGSYMVVDPRYEGLGLGFQLITKAIEFAEGYGSQGFKLKMRSTNSLLLKYYKRKGFEITEESTYPNSNLIQYELTKNFK